MARQAVGGRFALVVTVEAPPHGERCRLRRGFHLLDVAVARLARDAGEHVTLVREAYVVREIIHAYPGDRLFVFPIRHQFHDLGLFRHNDQVALNTPLH